MTARRYGSILAADFGSVTTRVLLLDVVDGEYRLVARGSTSTTIGYPIDDVSVGLRRILQDMGSSTGRTFFDADGAIITPEGTDRSGVDYFVTTASAGRPLRAVLIGLMPEISLKSALRAISGAYAEPAALLHLHDQMDDEARLNAILLSRPDLIFVAGGTEDGAETALTGILKTVQLALQLTDPVLRPIVLYAGNSRLAATAQKLFGDLTGVFIADNIRPSMEAEAFESAQLELGRAYDVHKEKHGEGFQRIGRMSSTGLLPTAQSYTLLAEYLAQARGGNILAVDMGSSATVLAGVFADVPHTLISTTIGAGHGAPTLVERVGAEKLAEWLPFYLQPGELTNYALNKALSPATIPMTARDLYLEQACVRAGLNHLVAEARPTWLGSAARGSSDLPLDTLIVGGAPLTSTGSPAYNLMLIIDSIRPTGMTEVIADPTGMVAALGALARVHPEAVVQLVDSDELERLGTVITVSGQPRAEKTALRLKIKTESGETVRSDVKGGHLLLLPVAPQERIEIDIQCTGGLTIGGQRRIRRQFIGGTAGLLFDVRGQPLMTGADVAERAQNLTRWVHEVTDDPLIEVPPDWLEAPAEPEIDLMLADLTAVPRAERVPRRRGLFGRRERGQPAAPANEAAAPEDDDFMALIEADQPAASAKGRKNQPPDDDLGSLRDLL